ICSFFVFFFFQAEDGIRDFHVTGVQTCALPICRRGSRAASARRSALPQDEVPDVYSIEDLRSPVSCPTHLGPPRASSAPADSLCPALPDLPADAHGLSASP